TQPKTEMPLVKHTLFDDTEIAEKTPFEGYIKTSELLKNMHVSYEEVAVENMEEFNQVEINKININEFVIVEAPKKPAESAESIKNEPNEIDEQILMFDLPINATAKKTNEIEKMEESTFSDLDEIEVQDHVEIVPVTEVSGEGIKRYSWDDYQEIESRLNSAKPTKLANKEIEDDEIVSEKRTVAEPNHNEADTNEDDDPLNSPIAKILSDRTEERKRKMKEFNYKFKNSPSRIDEIE